MSPGFTLVEITVVLAIISSLAILAFLGQGQIRDRAKFTDAVERTVSLLANAQNEANTTVNSGADTDEHKRGTDTGRIFFGMQVEFTDESSEVTTTPLWLDYSAGTCPPSCGIDPVEDQASSQEIPWGITYTNGLVTGQKYSVVFARRPSDGRPITYTPPLNWDSSNIYNYASYRTITDTFRKLQLEDGAGSVACITVTRGGHITKEFAPC